MIKKVKPEIFINFFKKRLIPHLLFIPRPYRKEKINLYFIFTTNTNPTKFFHYFYIQEDKDTLFYTKNDFRHTKQRKKKYSKNDPNTPRSYSILQREETDPIFILLEKFLSLILSKRSKVILVGTKEHLPNKTYLILQFKKIKKILKEISYSYKYMKVFKRAFPISDFILNIFFNISSFLILILLIYKKTIAPLSGFEEKEKRINLISLNTNCFSDNSLSL